MPKDHPPNFLKLYPINSIPERFVIQLTTWNQQSQYLCSLT